MYVLEHLSLNEAARMFWKTFIAKLKRATAWGFNLEERLINSQPKEKSFFISSPHRFPGNHCCLMPFTCTRRQRTGFKQSLKIALSARFIGVVIGFITPPPPFCGTAICNG